MVCLGFEPGVAGWKARTNPLSYITCKNSFVTNRNYFLQMSFPPNFCVDIVLILKLLTFFGQMSLNVLCAFYAQESFWAK